MKLTREFALKIQFLLDECLPPLIRDAKWFIWIPFKLLYRDRSNDFMNFKRRAFDLSEEEFSYIYRRVAPVLMERETDLTERVVNTILFSPKGETVLEVGCGKGFLSKALSKLKRVTACDIVIDPDIRVSAPHVAFIEANILRLPFDDRSFDTVICTHTLEHIPDIGRAIQELRRVTKERLIIVVPKQRPYWHTFDLHLHFFPYEYSLRSVLGPEMAHGSCSDIGGDWLYIEDRFSNV
jgi:ubiquinone/menaquinone biosynthesis C-methylase UbiE